MAVHHAEVQDSHGGQWHAALLPCSCTRDVTVRGDEEVVGVLEPNMFTHFFRKACKYISLSKRI